MQRTLAGGIRSISAIALAVGIDALGVGPDRHRAIGKLRDGAGRPDRSVHLIGPRIGGLDASSGRRPTDCSAGKSSCPATAALVSTRGRSSCSGKVAVSSHFAAAASARIALIAWNSLSATTARKLPSRTTLTTPGIFSTAAVSQSRQLRAIARRPHDAGMHHAGQAHVLHIGRAAGDLGRNVDARQRLAHHL